MEASWKFSGGVAKANLILSGTRILHRAWEFISEIQQSPRPISFAIREFPRFTILAFNSPSRRQDVLPNLESLVESHPLSFLITKDNPSVALDSFPLSTFCTLLKHPDLTDKLKTLTSKNQPRLIVVGHAEGGAVAALFTLWLLKNRSSATLPLCITYGSPFIGNKGLQTAIGKMVQSKSQFWHVLSLDDPVISSCGFPPSENDSAELQFKPFGTYLLLSESGYACMDDPNSVIELLRSADSAQTKPKDYGAMLQQLEQRTKYRKCNVQLSPSHDSLKVDLALQLQTLEIGHNQQLEGWEQADFAKAEKKGAAPLKEELKVKGAAPNVTHDSCFWAHLEEAALKLPELENGGEAKKEEIMQELREFEDYVMKLVNGYWLSPEAFYEGSSFMVWWRRYWEMLQRQEQDSDRDSRPFIVFMDKGGYRNYVNSAK